MAKPALVVSDLHLGGVPDAISQAFIRFTRHWQGRAELMVINGDLFDFWLEYRTAVLSQHFHVLRALADLRESGVRLVMLGGNHDAWGGAFLSEEIGIELADGPVELELGGRRALVAHGDGLGPGDLGYKLLKRMLRSRPAPSLLTERDDLDLVIFGHCHLPEVLRVGEHGYYVNSGDWVSHRTYTVIRPTGIDQANWTDEETLLT
jgi:UDP-2,3-diacylglucosamine hydrolase